MIDREPLLFWLARWKAAKMMMNALPFVSMGLQRLAAMNQMAYLCEVFSYMAERKERQNV